jgi:hypothetical protein
MKLRFIAALWLALAVSPAVKAETATLPLSSETGACSFLFA